MQIKKKKQVLAMLQFLIKIRNFFFIPKKMLKLYNKVIFFYKEILINFYYPEAC